MPLYTADAIVLRTYTLGEGDRIVVFLTRDRGKKRGVAARARRPRSPFLGALEPLTEAKVAYFESERRELVNLNYAETVLSPMRASCPEAFGYSHYFAELIDASAAEADADERLFRLASSVLDALTRCTEVDGLARYFECWLLRLTGIYPAKMDLSPGATAFVEGARRVAPADIHCLSASPAVLRELERAHRTIITAHLERELKSLRVVNEMRLQAL